LTSVRREVGSHRAAMAVISAAGPGISRRVRCMRSNASWVVPPVPHRRRFGRSGGRKQALLVLRCRPRLPAPLPALEVAREQDAGDALGLGDQLLGEHRRGDDVEDMDALERHWAVACEASGRYGSDLSSTAGGGGAPTAATRPARSEKWR
jgi:hypothetical protein